MIRRIVLIAAFALALGGCATYDTGYSQGYRDAAHGAYSGGYYAPPPGQGQDNDPNYDPNDYGGRPQVVANGYDDGYFDGQYPGYGYAYVYGEPGPWGYDFWPGFGYDPWFYGPWIGFGWYGGPWHGHHGPPWHHFGADQRHEQAHMHMRGGPPHR